MQVEIDLPGLGSGPLDVHMSRSSPGRYSLHEFAKNVSDVRASDPGGRALSLEQTTPSSWRIGTHGDRVRVSYRVFGDRADGTYLGVDTTHAHINIPATLMWVKGLEARPVTAHVDPHADDERRVGGAERARLGECAADLAKAARHAAIDGAQHQIVRPLQRHAADHQAGGIFHGIGNGKRELGANAPGALGLGRERVGAQAKACLSGEGADEITALARGRVTARGCPRVHLRALSSWRICSCAMPPSTSSTNRMLVR